MIQFTVGTEIARPPSEVFAHVTDPAKLATWQTNTISAVAESDQPFGLGTRVREVHRAPGGKQLASLVEVSEYDPTACSRCRCSKERYPSTPGSRSNPPSSAPASSPTRTDNRAARCASPNPSYASPSNASSPATAPRSNRCSRSPRPGRDRGRSNCWVQLHVTWEST